jgi:hypothetical protein
MAATKAMFTRERRRLAHLRQREIWSPDMPTPPPPLKEN